jgi:hypothetical protein
VCDDLSFLVDVVERFWPNVQRDERWDKVADKEEGEDVSNEVVLVWDAPGEDEEGEREDGGVQKKEDEVFDKDGEHFAGEGVPFFPVSEAFDEKIEQKVSSFDDKREYNWEENVLCTIIRFLCFSKISNEEITKANQDKSGTIGSKNPQISILRLELEIFPNNLMRLSQGLYINFAAIDLDETATAKWVKDGLVHVLFVLKFEVEFVLGGLELEEDFVGAEGLLLSKVELVFHV